MTTEEQKDRFRSLYQLELFALYVKERAKKHYEQLAQAANN